jgi:glycine hydroxymethyltransferase
VFHQQVCRRLSGQALLRRLRLCRRGRTLAIERAKQLFGCKFANVQPNSGSQMNQAVFLALLNPGDTFMGLDLPRRPPDPRLARQHERQVVQRRALRRARETEPSTWTRSPPRPRNKPKLIICGGTAYSRTGISPPSAPSPTKWARCCWRHVAHLRPRRRRRAPLALPARDIVTSTTHKSCAARARASSCGTTRRMSKPLNMAVFPGLQGGPLMHIVAAKAVAFKRGAAARASRPMPTASSKTPGAGRQP